MSRRHKTPEELERIQFRQRGSQGGSSLKSTSSPEDSASNHFESIDFVARKKDGSVYSFSADKIFRAIAVLENNYFECESTAIEFCTNYDPKYDVAAPEADDSRSVIQFALEEYLRSKGEAVERLSRKRGRRSVEQLLSNCKNEEVCSLFDKISTRFKRYFSKLKQIICCFFCALFDIVTTESPYGKETCYYKIIKSHIGEKIPSMGTIQKGIKWFWGWSKGVLSWKDRTKEKQEHDIWARLYHLIMGELPRLQPSLAIC